MLLVNRVCWPEDKKHTGQETIKLSVWKKSSTLSALPGILTFFLFLLASGHQLDWPHQYTGLSWAQVSKFKQAFLALREFGFRKLDVCLLLFHAINHILCAPCDCDHVICIKSTFYDCP